MCVCVCVCVCIYICFYISIYVYVYIYIYPSIYRYTYMYIYIHIASATEPEGATSPSCVQGYLADKILSLLPYSRAAHKETLVPKTL